MFRSPSVLVPASSNASRPCLTPTSPRRALRGPSRWLMPLSLLPLLAGCPVIIEVDQTTSTSGGRDTDTDDGSDTDELVDTIVEQSDAHSGAHDVRELERIRDQNLVGFLKVLEANRWAAGRSLASQRKQLRAQ